MTADVDERTAAAELAAVRAELAELRAVIAQAAETQLVYAHNLHCWAHDVSGALSRVGRRFGVSVDPPVFPSALTAPDGD